MTCRRTASKFLSAPSTSCLFKGCAVRLVKMASALLPSVSKCQVLMEHFDNPDQLQDAINCSEECVALLKYPAATPVSEYCPVHLRRELYYVCIQCGTDLCSHCCSSGHSTHRYTTITSVTNEETRRLGEAVDHMTGLLEETKRAVSVVKEMRQRVRGRKEHNMERTREMFNALRKVIDKQEEQVIADITEGADKRENALKVLFCSCNMSGLSDMSTLRHMVLRLQVDFVAHFVTFNNTTGIFFNILKLAIGMQT